MEVTHVDQTELIRSPKVMPRFGWLAVTVVTHGEFLATMYNSDTRGIVAGSSPWLKARSLSGSELLYPPVTPVGCRDEESEGEF